MFRFKFKKRKHKETEQEREFVEKEVRRIPKVISTIFFVYIVLFLIIMIWYFCFKSVYYISKVEGSSMKPTINSGISDSSHASEDFVYVNTKKKASHGDIVVLTQETNPIIKRVIAKEGDQVSIFVTEDGLYHVAIKYSWAESPEILEENYVKSYREWRNSTAYSQTKTDSGIKYESVFYNTFINNGSGYNENVSVIDGVYYYNVPTGNYFCLGDNRGVSSDSRARGTFTENQIKGVADIIVKGGSQATGNLALKKFSAIVSYYWKCLENTFAR